ncbi:MAG: nucleotidyl transferase AbiEii/AbiGii toxin family protein [Saprospiraceae bacterium]
MHENILSEEQKALLPFVQSFRKEFYLVGGTAIALQIGHRVSIDFDLFKSGSIQPAKISKRFEEFDLPFQLLFQDANGMHLLSNGVKITFYQFPFKVEARLVFESIKMPDLLHLAAMKAYALGRRAKWKDYVDLYFVLKNHHPLPEVSAKAKSLFGELFSPKLFVQQLCYFGDVNYTEEIEYVDKEVPDAQIREFLEGVATGSF